ncbi:hypothetical protein JI721_13320 [Alicyclobacillus cycloheptanicus]|uniref:N-acetyltransferase domain-containing protein n=1 Tax=Alicyclobacillus cycloheptanicus TaxID=1457 RepID=A0ABT9XFX5_9BACL|nr:hypothetical protein [Alicyclobacillus cycloheptanicus]MDQ0188656.1 hypothetical protein [Alicyclobacillus cycloheptanicus]WDM00670.1 hypothetical protein JI721_13320 [Alicyclobacillus cycloheptanicus]
MKGSPFRRLVQASRHFMANAQSTVPEWQDLVWHDALADQEIVTRMVDDKRLRPVIQSVAESWLSQERWLHTQPERHAAEEESAPLAHILLEIWQGELGAQPMPEVVIAEAGAAPLGVLCGYRDYGQKYFFIEHVALHPALRATSPRQLWRNAAGERVCQRLVEAAVDISHRLGFFGWTACAPAPGTESAWNQLKFYRHDDLTFRRMGYFT